MAMPSEPVLTMELDLLQDTIRTEKNSTTKHKGSMLIFFVEFIIAPPYGYHSEEL
jgi:hypothetical protein